MRAPQEEETNVSSQWELFPEELLVQAILPFMIYDDVFF
jgi:hypothetical protein